MPRTGDEPSTARSPLMLRAVLAGFGLACGVAGLAGFALDGRGRPALAFGALGLVAALDLAVVIHHIRQGAHFQPGPGVPPYHPVEPRPATSRRPAGPRGVPSRRRVRIYLVMMSACLLLLLLAWTWVRLHSTGLAVAMTVFAMVIPPIAAVVANRGALSPEQPRRPPSP